VIAEIPGCISKPKLLELKEIDASLRQRLDSLSTRAYTHNIHCSDVDEGTQPYRLCAAEQAALNEEIAGCNASIEDFNRKIEIAAGKKEVNIGGVPSLLDLDDGGVAAFSGMDIDFDGSSRAYNSDNSADAMDSLCNAGTVYLPNGSHYSGSKKGKCPDFMSDFKKINDAGWKHPSVGAIHWFGVLGEEEETATINGKTIDNVVPVLQKDGSGFYVSPTGLVDSQVKDLKDQNRYVNPLRVPFAVIPGALSKGFGVGTFGVAIDERHKIAVPFVVGDTGPKIGEGSVALSRLVAGKAVSDQITRNNRYVGLVGQGDPTSILWVFFGGTATKYDHNNEDQLAADAQMAFNRWGGKARLDTCFSAVPRN
jgi:hypothetical protein